MLTPFMTICKVAIYEAAQSRKDGSGRTEMKTAAEYGAPLGELDDFGGSICAEDGGDGDVGEAEEAA